MATLPNPAVDQRIQAAQSQLDTSQVQHAQQQGAELGGLEKQLSAVQAQPDPVRQSVPLPQRPNQPVIDTKQLDGFASALVGMAMIAGAAGGRERWLNTLTSLNGAMSGYIEGKQELAQEHLANFDRDFKSAMAKNEQANKEFNDILNQKNKSINQIMTEYRIAAAKWGRVDAQDAAQERRIDRMYQSKQQYDIAQERLQAQYDKLHQSITAHTPIGKLNEDLKNGVITKEQYDAAMQKSGGSMGAREAVFTQRVILSGNEAAADLSNVASLPLSASTGFFGGRHQGPGLMDATKEVMANKLTTQEVQVYNVMATGFQRSLAAIESAGLAPSGSLTHQMDTVLLKEGDDNLTKVAKLAQIRQIVEAGLDIALANPRVSGPEKAKVQQIMDKVKQAVPFTQKDVIKLMTSDGQKTLKDFMTENKPEAGSSPVKGGTVIKLDAQGNEVQ